jgi:four-jointed box protein 1
MTHEIMIANEYEKSSNGKRAENCSVNDKTVVIDDTMLLILRKKRRTLCHHTCFLSVMAAFTIGLLMGIFFLPLIGLTSAKTSTAQNNHTNSNNNSNLIHIAAAKHSKLHKYDMKSGMRRSNVYSRNQIQDNSGDHAALPPTINNNNNNNNNNNGIDSSVSFISDEKYSTENILNGYNNARRVDFVAADHNDDHDADDAIEMFNENSLSTGNDDFDELQEFRFNYEGENNATMRQIIESGIYWGAMVESRIPNGFSKRDTAEWQDYLINNVTEIIKIEHGCGRMQNRLVTFSDGVKACVRYRQNTDQIQGELFSFFLGRLLNISNLVPSTASVIDWESRLWLQVKKHITESQWKTSRPVVFTKWIPDLEPSGIPEQFRPLERHMNMNDIWNITMNDDADHDDDDDDDATMKRSQILIDRLKPKYSADSDLLLHSTATGKRKLWQQRKMIVNNHMVNKFIELAQWSDLIIFDYLIANLDRVVNNLYNFQWNADIMAAPAHNLAKQINSQLLVFLDNESGLLHGYRLLKKYEAYHSLLLDELCIFRKSTIDALRHLRQNSPGELLNDLFESSTTGRVREVLPPLPDRSVKILSERIDRVLQQVQKCQEIYSNR